MKGFIDRGKPTIIFKKFDRTIQKSCLHLLKSPLIKKSQPIKISKVVSQNIIKILTYTHSTRQNNIRIKDLYYYFYFTPTTTSTPHFFRYTIETFSQDHRSLFAPPNHPLPLISSFLHFLITFVKPPLSLKYHRNHDFGYHFLHPFKITHSCLLPFNISPISSI